MKQHNCECEEGRLAGLRQSIDRIDEQILDLVNRRLMIAQEIGEVKKESGSQVLDSERESEILTRLTVLNHGPLKRDVLRHIFLEIITASRTLQESRRAADTVPRTGLEL